MGRAKFAFDQVDVGEAARAAVVKRHELKASQSRLLFENSLLRSPGGGKQTPPRPKHMVTVARCERPLRLRFHC